jgi:PPM family protein phosphatase
VMHAHTGNGRLVIAGSVPPIDWGLCSDQGPSREHNEDFAAAWVDTATAAGRPPLFVVADGLGGHAAGEVASRIATERTVEHWRGAAGEDPAKALRGAVRAANAAVHAASFDPGRGGMASTLTALTVAGREAHIAHVGDSRAYLVRGDSCLQLTSDHSRVGEMLRMKLLTPEQAANHPARSQLTRSLGSAPGLQVDLVRHELRAGDVFVLCTDGLWGEMAQSELVDAVRGVVAAGTAQAAALALYELAVARQAADNVTALVVAVLADLPAAPPAEKRSLMRWRR